jgi:hypothetical protein
LNPKPNQSVFKTNGRFKRYNLTAGNAELKNAVSHSLSGVPPIGLGAAWAIQPSIENPNKGLQKTSIKPVPNCE